MIKFAGNRGWPDPGEMSNLTKNDIHLTWKLSDDIDIVLCFNCHDGVLSEMSLITLAVFLFVSHLSL